MSAPGSQEFDLERFLPYLLNQAAEVTSKSFHNLYRESYGMTRTQWRVMANIGKFGAMTARDICAISFVEKTKVSRAVAALELQGYLTRARSEQDGRAEILSLTEPGQQAFRDLGQRAIEYDAEMRRQLGPQLTEQLDQLLRRLIAQGKGEKTSAT